MKISIGYEWENSRMHENLKVKISWKQYYYYQNRIIRILGRTDLVKSCYGLDDGLEWFSGDVLVGFWWAELRGQAIRGVPAVVGAAGVDHGLVATLAAGKRQEILLNDAFGPFLCFQLSSR